MASKQDRTKAALVKRLSEVRIVEIACKSVSISRATYYRWLKEDARFASDCEDAIRRGTAVICDLAESQIINKIRGGDFKASTYFLEKHHKDYAPMQRAAAPPYQRDRARKFFSEQPMDEKTIKLVAETLESLESTNEKGA
jgi:hypothetical protein